MTLDGSMDSNSLSSDSTQGDDMQEVRSAGFHYVLLF